MNNEIDVPMLPLVFVTAVIIAAAAVVAWIQKKTRFGAAKYWVQQLVIGLVFGGVAILATEMGIPVGGAAINARDAAPLTAGLLFGWPSGLISGVIGGVERFLAAAWGAGQYTRFASSGITILAGAVGGLLNYWFFQKQRPAWWYALSVALCIEVVHMLLILVTNLQDLETAFGFVSRCAGYMIAADCIAVMSSAAVVRRMQGAPDPNQHEKLEYILQRSLFFSVMVAMIVSSLFIWMLQSSLIVEKARSLLEVKLYDAPRGVRASLNASLVGYTDWLADSMLAEEGSNITTLPTLVKDTVKEAYLIDPETREVLISSEESIVGTTVPEEWQSTFILASGTNGYTTPYGESVFDGEEVKYALIYLADGRALVIGFKSEFVQEELGRDIQLEAENRHVGQTGYLIMIDEDGAVDSSNREIVGPLEDIGFDLETPGTVLLNQDLSDPVYYMTRTVSDLAGNTYVFIAAQPVEEASFVSMLAMYVTIFMEIVIFAVLFMKLSSLIRKEMVHKLEAVNTSLSILTAGNLDEIVDVRSTEEFAKLSDGINATVASLKQYSAEMQKRMDRELEFARIIQRAALPSVFPPFPARKDFEIYASMDAAKVVGGDFYDFYLLNDHTLAFLIADVSGKGVPAAMFMMRAKTQIKDLIESGMDVAEVFSRTNSALCENNTANMFVTAWMGVLDLSTGLLRYVNAGHTPPLMRRYQEDFRYLDTEVDFVLGGLDDVVYQAGEILMQPGDTIFIYTDGVTEADNVHAEQFGEERLLESVQAGASDELEVLCGRVLSDVEKFAGEAEQFDDITMLAVRLNGLMSRTTIQLRPDRASTGAALRFASQRLRELQIQQSYAESILRQIRAIWQQILERPGSEVVLTLRREDEGLFVSFYDDGPPGKPTIQGDAGLQIYYDRAGNHNLLELHWRMDPAKEDDQDTPS
ncbi:MAG: SpoIIE family protein phosphatase [Clostridia bacterium]|nr:SpoIIE family protein phosphatase [Clostridia bacterium]